MNLATSGSVRYTLVDEGELVSYKTRTLEALGLASNAANVQFSQGDACNLKPRADWLGGFKKDGETYTTLDALHEHLSAHFEPLQAAQDVPFVIRETRRKYQHSVSEASFWVRVR